MKNKYITVLDFEVERIFQYKLGLPFLKTNLTEVYLTRKGHNLTNCKWMVHDIKEFVDHTIRSTIKKNK